MQHLEFPGSLHNSLSQSCYGTIYEGFLSPTDK